MAQAQPASGRAQSLFDEGLQQLKNKNYARACTAFEGSQKLDPRVTTLLNLAACREQNGQLATAWALRRALDEAQEDRNERALYFVHCLDYRGRVYPVASNLSPHGPDLIRALCLLPTSWASL